MNDLYLEWMVKKKDPSWALPAKLAMAAVTVLFFLASAVGFGWYMVIIGAAFGYLTYYMSLNWDLEYEYTYVKGEIMIDKIMGKSRRKRLLLLELENMEIIAPEKSHQLDAYHNKQCKVLDYSSHIPDNKKYVIYGTNKKEQIKLIFEPTEEMVKDMYNLAPRKVFVNA